MLKMGIPKDAIKQKMNILDLDTRYIDYPETTPYVTFIHYISNPQLGSYVNSKTKPKDKPNENENDNENTVLNNSILQFRPNIQLNLLNNIKSGEIKLKKVITNDKLSSVVKNTKSLKVPSLGDIQGALSKLKKINLESQSDI